MFIGIKNFHYSYKYILSILITTSLSLFVHLFSACSNNGTTESDPKEELTPEVYFTLKIDSEWLTLDSKDNWIIIHDENGQLLDYREYKNGDNLIFETLSNTLTDKLTITTFSYNTSPTLNTYSITTYPDIPKSSTWTFKHSPLISKPLVDNNTTGKFSITVDNIPEFKKHVLSGDNRINNANSNITISPDPRYDSLNITDIDLFERNDYILTILDGNGNLKHLKINNVQNNDHLNFDYNNFNDFDDYLNINLDSPMQTNLEVLALKETLNDDLGVYTLDHNLDFSYIGQTKNFVKIGYLDMFKKYKIRFNLNYEDYSIHYRRRGDKVKSLNIPTKPDFNINVSALSDFNLTISSDYVRQISYWHTPNDLINDNKNKVVWEISSDSNSNLNFPGLPDDIKNTYPNLDLNSLKYSGTTLFLKSESQSDFINNSFVINKADEEFELLFMFIRNN